MQNSMNISSLLLLGGLAFFIYGVSLVRIGLQALSEDRLRTLIATATKSRLAALGVGVLTAVILQSSSATTVMLVGFANSDLIGLTQAMGLVLGAELGTSLIVQLLSLHVADWSLLFVVIGVLCGFIWRKSRLAHLGAGILGFGLIFYGMNLMGEASEPLKNSEIFQQLLVVLARTPLWLVLASALFTSLVQSSAVTIGLALSLAEVGAMHLEVAIPIVLGANIGTCTAGLVSGFAGGPKGKRVAYSRLAFKILGTLLVLPFLDQFAVFCRSFTAFFAPRHASEVREIANAHFLFNLALSVVFLPFIDLAAKLITRWVPDLTTADPTDHFKTRFLDENALDTPALAQGNVTQEILRAAGIVHGMLKDSIEVFERRNDILVDKIEEADDRVDYLDRQIRFYIAKIAQSHLTKEQAARQIHLLNITTNLEAMGDIVNRDLVNLAKKLWRKNVTFSREGWEEIRDFFSKVTENYSLALAAFGDRSQELAHKVIRHERTLGELEATLKQNHLARLQTGLKESIDTSSIHLELLSELRRINTLLTVFAVAVIDRRNAI